MTPRAAKMQTVKQRDQPMMPEQVRHSWANRPVGRAPLVLLVALIVCAPWLLFFDPISLPGHPHIARDPAAIYRLQNDDFAYVAASRTLGRTLSNLFAPHNTHIVPAWRILTWLLVAQSGSLARLPETLAQASYGILVAVMLMVSRLVSRETGRTGLGLAAMSAVGTTSLMLPSAVWYSAGQTLWAGFGILSALWYAQRFRRSLGRASLALAGLATMIAGWFWTIGHLAGPITAIYLWRDGRQPCRLAAAVPVGAALLAVLLTIVLGAGKIDSTVSFHGRTTREAARPRAGLLHTAQAIPENLVFANLGLRVRTTQAQGVVLTLTIVGLWLARRLRQGGTAALNPLECAGLALVLGSYFGEWTVRGYFDYYLLRTLNLGYIVPWYDTIPHIGAVLFVAGWIAGPRQPDRRTPVFRPIQPLSRGEALSVLGLLAISIILNGPRVDLLWRKSTPPLLPSEEKKYPIVELQSMRATALLLDRARWQRRYLERFDQAQRDIRRRGISRDAVREAFGRLDVPDLPNVYDGIGLLDFPEPGQAIDPAQARRALERYLFKEDEPRPPWIRATENWPPSLSPQQIRLEVYGGE